MSTILKKQIKIVKNENNAQNFNKKFSPKVLKMLFLIQILIRIR